MHIIKHTLLLCVSLFAGAATAAEHKPYVTSRSLDVELAQQAATAALQNCRTQGYQVAVAVVDRSGQLLAFARDPLAGPHTIEVSQRKAFTAATYQAATSGMMGRDELRGSPGVLLLGGGLPIRIGGHFYGAVAVSGAPAIKVSGDADEACAQAGIDTIREVLEFAD
jgi:uncharacterized protein GlcG (DUF336 family)